MNINKVVLVALGALVFLVIITLIISSSLSKRSVVQNMVPTLVPTQPLENRGTTIAPSDYNSDKTNALTDSQKQRLETFMQKGDIETDKFSIGYSPYLNQFFVQKKTADADQALTSYLQANNLTDIFKTPGLLVATTDTPRQAIAKVEDVVRNKVSDGSTTSLDQNADPATQNYAQTLFVDTSKILLDFKLNVGGGGGGTANCPQAQGNEKILCAAKAYDGLPYRNTGGGQFFGHPPSAWVAGFESGDGRYKNLDCSGLVNVAMFKGMGQDMQAFSGTYYGDSRFAPVDLSAAKPGDLVIIGGPHGAGNAGHIAIFESYDGKNLQIFNSAGRGVKSESGNWMRSRSGFAIRRYIGPGSTP